MPARESLLEHGHPSLNSELLFGERPLMLVADSRFDWTKDFNFERNGSEWHQFVHSLESIGERVHLRLNIGVLGVIRDRCVREHVDADVDQPVSIVKLTIKQERVRGSVQRK